MAPKIRCKAKNADGSRCGAPSNMVDRDLKLCPTHAPGGRERVREAGKKGGAATARKFDQEGFTEDELPDLETPQDAAKRLDMIAQAVGVGRLGHREGRSMTYAVKEWLSAFEAGEMAERVQELRERLEDLA